MIYISSACVKNNDLESCIRTLVKEGFRNIELSGGTNYQEDSLELLLGLKKELAINFLCHNYFPIPEEAFVLNLASLEEETAAKSLAHCKTAIDYSKKLGAKKFAFHAGFLMNIPLNQVGKKIEKVELFNKELAYDMFHQNLKFIQKYNNSDIQLYIENNVLSNRNKEEFYPEDPFFFTSRKNFEDINLSADNYLPLLDVAHLKVSCQSLGLDLEKELKFFFKKTDYIHISDNDSLSDSNQGLKRNSNLHELLQKVWTGKKTVTLEVYSGLDDVHEAYQLIKELN